MNSSEQKGAMARSADSGYCRRSSVLVAILALCSVVGSAYGATGGWVTPSSITDPENKWVDEAGASDLNEISYAEDRASRVSKGPFLHLHYGTPIYSDRLRVSADFGYGVVDRVDVHVRYEGDSAFTPVHEGAIPNVAYQTIAFVPGRIAEVRFRFNYLVSGWWFWLYEINLF